MSWLVIKSLIILQKSQEVLPQNNSDTVESETENIGFGREKDLGEDIYLQKKDRKLLIT